jgi:Zn-finger nucleic acid-binding protein
MVACPRDGSLLEVVHRADQRFEIDLCKECGGVWLDAHELSGLCPTAAHLPERRLEAVLGAVAAAPDIASAGIAACPRCGQRPHQLVLAGIAIDFCAGCGGIWLDHDEALALVRDPPMEQKAKVASGSPFRQTATELVTNGRSRCGDCGSAAQAKDLFARRDGFVCFRCWTAQYQEQADMRAKDGTLLRGLTTSLLDVVMEPIEAIADFRDRLFDPRPKAWRDL